VQLKYLYLTAEDHVFARREHRNERQIQVSANQEQTVITSQQHYGQLPIHGQSAMLVATFYSGIQRQREELLHLQPLNLRTDERKVRSDLRVRHHDISARSHRQFQQ